MAFKLTLPKFNFPKPNLGSSVSTVGSALRFVIVKIIGVLLGVVFLSLALLFISYSVVSVASSIRGQKAKVLLVSDHVGKHRTAFRLGGLFQVTAEMEKKKYGKIYCLYPVWPDSFQPAK